MDGNISYPKDINDALLEHFGQTLLSQLKRFSRLLSTLDTDIAVFLARKAVCMLDIFEALGWDLPDTEMISDRAVDDGKIIDLSGKRVAIVDDIVVLGTTVAQLTSEFYKFGAKKVDYCIFSINKRWHAEKCYIPTGNEILFDSYQASDFCNKIVEAISICGKPYAVDFPLFEYTADYDDRFHPLEISCDGIETFDSTTNFNARHKQRRYVAHFERDYVYQLIGNYLPSESPAIAKLRYYCFPFEKYYRIMPFLTFDKLSATETRKILKKIIDDFQKKGINISNDFLDVSPKQINRIYHYIMSALLYWRHITSNDYFHLKHTTISLSRCLDRRRLFMSFGKSHGDEILKIISSFDKLNFDNTMQNNAVHSADYSPIGMYIVKAVEDSRLSYNKNDIMSALSNCFTSIYLQIELPTREFTKKEIDEDCKKYSYGDMAQRLETGFTYNDIKLFLSKNGFDFGNHDLDKMLSTYLDIFIDRGVIVPCTATHHSDSSITYRIYRHGEDVIFAYGHYKSLSESLLYAQTGLREFSNNENEKLRRIETEKLLVLLVKLMFAKQLCTPITDTSIVDQYINVGFERMGAVVKSNELIVIEDVKSKWLHDAFEKSGIISDNEIINDNIFTNKDTVIDEDSQFLLDRFAQYFSLAMRDDDDDKLSIILASCSNAVDSLTAIITDLNFCCKDIIKQEKAFWEFVKLDYEIVPRNFDDRMNFLNAIKEKYLTLKYNNKRRFVTEFRKMFSGYAKNAIDNSLIKGNAFTDFNFYKYLDRATDKLCECFPDENREKKDALRIWRQAWSNITSGGRFGFNAEMLNSTYASAISFARKINCLFQIIHVVSDFVNDATISKPRDTYFKVIRDGIEIFKDNDVLLGKLQLMKDVLACKEKMNDRLNIYPELANVIYKSYWMYYKTWESVIASHKQILLRERSSRYYASGQLNHLEFLLWYDIIDSRLKRKGLSGTRKSTLQNFKTRVNHFLVNYFYSLYGKKSNVPDSAKLPFATLESINSQNDEKYIFIKDRSVLFTIMYTIMEYASNLDIPLRMACCSCNSIDNDRKIYQTGLPCIASGDGLFFSSFASIKDSLRDCIENIEQVNGCQFQKSYIFSTDKFFLNKFGVDGIQETQIEIETIDSLRNYNVVFARNIDFDFTAAKQGELF